MNIINLVEAATEPDLNKLHYMNKTHAVLPIGGKTRVATWGNDPDFPGRQTIIRFSPFADFKALHDKYRYSFEVKDKNGNMETITMGLGSWWLSQPKRRQYDGGMRFMPNRDEKVVNETLNLWEGFAITARKPDGKSGAAGCQLLLDHGFKIICSGNEAHFDYLIKREAFIAQRRMRSEIAVGLKTETEGTGKGFWSRAFNHLYGPHAMEVQKPEHVLGKHNAHLESLVRLTADEAIFAGDPRHRNGLYNLITELLTIERKFIDAYSANNYLNLDIISNAAHFLPASGSARRLFVPTVSSERANDFEYFRKMNEQLVNGGYEALLYHLLHEIDLRDFNVRAVPKTDMLAEQVAYSRKGVDALVEHACNIGEVPCPSIWPEFSNCSGYEQRSGFDYFIDHHADRDLARMGALMVKRRLAKDWGCITGKATRKQADGVRSPGIIWPDLLTLRAKFEAKYGPQDWLCPNLTGWGKTDPELQEALKTM
jgi:Mesyanzhinovviridae DNA primase